MIKAIVTGHSRGLGAAIATCLLEQGVQVLGIARSENAALAARFPQAFTQMLPIIIARASAESPSHTASGIATRVSHISWRNASSCR